LGPETWRPEGVEVRLRARSCYCEEMVLAPVLHTVRVGVPRTIDDEEPWATAFYKSDVSGRLMLERENLVGDRQADLTVHGGPDKAVCVYSADHYDDWRREVRVPDAGPGWFGENFTVAGATEQTVAIGDIYRVGGAVVQVSQPRGPCWKLAHRWNRPEMVKLVVRSGRSGWYFRVLEVGYVAAGDTLTLVERLDERWTIAKVNTLTYARGARLEALRALRSELAEFVPLADTWRAALIDSMEA
jgi:MOSC domain-containing protein YiiM